MSFIKESKKAYKQVQENHIAIAMGKMLDDEGSMVLNQLEELERAIKMIRDYVGTDYEKQLPAWVQAKVTLASDYISTVGNYLSSKNEKVTEEAIKEEFDLKETSLTAIHKMKEDGKTTEEIAKELKLNTGLVKKILGEQMAEAVDPSKATKLKMISIKGDQKEITIDKKDLEKYLKLDYVIKEYLPEESELNESLPIDDKGNFRDKFKQVYYLKDPKTGEIDHATISGNSEADITKNWSKEKFSKKSWQIIKKSSIFPITKKIEYEKFKTTKEEAELQEKPKVKKQKDQTNTIDQNIEPSNAGGANTQIGLSMGEDIKESIIHTIKNILLENKAAEDAKKQGLEYYGFGRYGKNKTVTHKSVNGNLKQLPKDQQTKVDDKDTKKEPEDKENKEELKNFMVNIEIPYESTESGAGQDDDDDKHEERPEPYHAAFKVKAKDRAEAIKKAEEQLDKIYDKKTKTDKYKYHKLDYDMQDITVKEVGNKVGNIEKEPEDKSKDQQTKTKDQQTKSKDKESKPEKVDLVKDLKNTADQVGFDDLNINDDEKNIYFTREFDPTLYDEDDVKDEYNNIVKMLNKKGINYKPNFDQDVEINDDEEFMQIDFGVPKNQKIEEHIVKVKGGYQLQSKSTGKNLGTYPTKAGAEKRERQVQYFKHNEETKEPTGELKDACWPGYTAVGFKMKNGKRVPNCVPKSEAYKGAKSIVEKAWKKVKK